MATERIPGRAAIAFGAYRFLTQLISWTITLAVARLLRPEDYGLMALASLFTGYVEVFSELGLGAAIVQRREITQSELSSNFWFSVQIGAALAVLTIPLAYLTSWVFRDPRVLPITASISVLFLSGGFTVVPFNLLFRELRFGAIGLSQLVAALAASLSMLWFAHHGFGVWTLILGAIILRFTTMGMVFLVSGWRPSFHFSFREVQPFLRFGVNVAASRSVFYLFQKSDKFIVGKILGPTTLGHYSFALDLASVPNDRVVAAANQLSFPMFARHQTDPEKIRSMFLTITKYIAWLAFPVYLGGAAFGHLLVPILGAQWEPAIWLFRYFCLAYLVISVTSLNSVLQNSLGHSRSVLRFHLASIAVLAPSIVVAAHYGTTALVVPWLVLYPALLLPWTYMTLRVAGVPLRDYLAVYRTPLVASAMMIIGIVLIRLVPAFSAPRGGSELTVLIPSAVIAVAIYGIALFAFERRAIVELWNRRKSRRQSEATPTS